MRTIAVALSAVIACGALAGCVVREQTTVYERRPLYVQPQPEVVEAPVIVDYTAVAPPPVITEYVLIGGAYYYYHPERHVFVHVTVIQQGVAVRRIGSWSEHPMYAQAQHVAPPPRTTVVAPPPPPRRGRGEVTAVVVAPPVIVEAAAVAPPARVTEYVLLNGSYYYYHPGRKVFVHVAAPARGVAVREIHAWNEHPMYGEVQHVEVRRGG